MKSKLILILFGICSTFCLAAQPVAITNAKIYTMAGPLIEKGTVLIRDGRIEAVGVEVAAPADARVIDASGHTVLPGFIDANCHVGLAEISLVPATVDSSETIEPVTAQLMVTDGFFPESKAIGVTRMNGVTTGVVSPDDVNVISGMSALIHFSEKRIDEIVVQPRAAMNATLGEAPKSAYGSKNKAPMSRMGSAALLREALQKTKDYVEKWKYYQDSLRSGKKAKKNKEPEAPPERDLELEALQDVLAGKMPLVLAAHRIDDILTAIRIADEFGIKQNLVLNHATDGYKIADLLAREKIPVLVGPVTTQPDRIETLGARYENAAILQKAGVLIAIQSNETHNARNLPYEAALAVANGLPYEEALKAITINPARIFRIDHEIGSIEKGKRADLIVAAGDPLEPKTAITHVFIDGEEIPQTSYHKQLWEEFQRNQH